MRREKSNFIDFSTASPPLNVKGGVNYNIVNIGQWGNNIKKEKRIYIYRGGAAFERKGLFLLVTIAF